MAKQPGTINPEDVKRQLGSFLEKAVEAFGEVKDAVVRTSQVGKIKLDATFLRRERDRLFQRLGEELFDLVEDGKLDLPDALGPLAEQLRELERKLAEQEEEIAAVHAEASERRTVEREEAAAARRAEAEQGGADEDRYDDELEDEELEDEEEALEDAEDEDAPAATEPPKAKPAKKKTAKKHE